MAGSAVRVPQSLEFVVENSCGNETLKSHEKIFSVQKEKSTSILFFYEN